MNVFELFVHLLDESELTNLLTRYKIQVPGFRMDSAPEERKRKALLGALRSSPMRKRKDSNWWLSIFNRYTFPHLDDVPDDDYLPLISVISAPDYAKLAYTFTNRHDIFKAIYPELVEKFQTGKQLFDFQDRLGSDENAVQVIKRSLQMDQPGYADRLFSTVYKRMPKSLQQSVDEISKEVGHLPFTEFLKTKSKMMEKYSDNLILFAYGKFKTDLDGALRSQYAFFGAIELIKVLEREADKLKNELEGRIEQLQADLAEEKKSVELLNKSLTKKEEELAKIANILAEREKEEKELQKQLTVQFKKQMDEANQKILELTMKNGELFESVNSVKEMIKLWAGDRKPILSFAIIYSLETHLLSELYPEIIAYSIKDWKKHRDQLSGFRAVYIQRDGCSTAQIQELKRTFPKTHVFAAGTDKDLIEMIEQIKQKEGVVRVS